MGNAVFQTVIIKIVVMMAVAALAEPVRENV
jgi:hypothetical protein